MPPLHVLVKPASSQCQLRCQYCFYLDEAQNRATPNHGFMSLEILEVLIRKACAEAEGTLTLAFQGGEPTLRGLPFYEAAVRYVQAHAPEGLAVNYAIQTNGVALDDAWCRFFREHGFLVGLSLDGTRGTHDRYRVTPQADGSFATVWAAWQRLQSHGVETNILTVVTPYLADRIETVYRFYRDKGMLWQQYIPCLSPLGGVEPAPEHVLTSEAYGRFLSTLFDLWYADITQGRPIYIRTFENWVGMHAGYPPESCGLAGVCVAQHVVEADGSVYPCDFYCVDACRLGNITEDETWASLREAAKPFIEASWTLPEVCQHCDAWQLCRGGCRRDRIGFDHPLPLLERGLAVDAPQPVGLNRYCQGIQTFYAYARPRFEALAAGIQRRP